MIDKISNTIVNDKVKSVYSFNDYSIQDLLSKFFEQINSVTDLVNQNEEKINTQNFKLEEFINYMKNEGIPPIVIETVTTMYNDGRLTELFNSLANNVIDKVEEFKTQVNSQLEQITNEDIYISIGESVVEINKKIENALYKSKRVILEVGEHIIDDTLIIPNNIELFSSSYENTVIKSSANKPIIKIGGISNKLKNIKLGYINKNDDLTLQDGVYCDNTMDRCIFENVKITVNGTGFNIQQDGTKWLYNNRFKNIEIKDCGQYGFVANTLKHNDLSWFNYNLFENLTLERNGYGGMKITGYDTLQALSFIQCDFSNNKKKTTSTNKEGFGLYCDSYGANISMKDCYVEGYKFDFFHYNTDKLGGIILKDVANFTFEGGTFSANTRDIIILGNKNIDGYIRILNPLLITSNIENIKEFLTLLYEGKNNIELNVKPTAFYGKEINFIEKSESWIGSLNGNINCDKFIEGVTQQKIIYVDSVNGYDSYTGLNPNFPKRTIENALKECTSLNNTIKLTSGLDFTITNSVDFKSNVIIRPTSVTKANIKNNGGGVINVYGKIKTYDIDLDLSMGTNSLFNVLGGELCISKSYLWGNNANLPIAIIGNLDNPYGTIIIGNSGSGGQGCIYTKFDNRALVNKAILDIGGSFTETI